VTVFYRGTAIARRRFRAFRPARSRLRSATLAPDDLQGAPKERLVAVNPLADRG
jgi:hypothetical protein